MTVRKACSYPAFGFPASSVRGLVAVFLCWFVFAALGLPTPYSATQANAQEAKPKEAPAANWEQLIYVPYKQLSTVFEKQKATVFMSYAEYLKLWTKSVEPLGQPPVAAVISAASYRAKIDQDVARIEAEYSVRVLGKAWSELPLKFGDAAVGDVISEGGADDKAGEKVLLRATGDGTYSLLFPTPGEHKVKIQLAARVRSSPDGKSFDLEVPAVGVTKFELLIPEADQAVEVTPLLVRQAVEAKGKETKIVGNLGAASRIGVLWHPKASIKPEMDLLASVTNHTQVSVADGLIHTDAYLRYEVLRGELTQLRIAVPKGDRILGVSSNDANVKGLKEADEATRQVVTIELLSGAKKTLTLEVHTERPAPAGAFDVVGLNDNAPAAGIHALDVVRESGQLVVTKGADLLLNIEKLTGLTRIEEAEVAESIRRPGSLAYKFYSPKVELKLTTKSVEPRVLVNHVAKLQFLDDELRSLTQVSYTIERAGLFELQLRVPDKMVIDRVVGPPQIKEYPVETKEGQKVLRVVLDMKREGAIQFNVIGHVPLDATQKEQNLTLPLLEPLNVERETGQVTIFAAPAIEVLTDEKAIKGVQPERNADPNPPFVAGGTLASAWSFTRRPVEIPVKTTRRPTRLTAMVATLLNAKTETADVRTTVTYKVEFAGLDTFQIAVPEALAGAVQIRTAQGATVPAIKEKKKAEKAVEGWVTWTIVLQREAIGDVPFEITYDLKPAEGQDKKAGSTLSWQQELKPVRAVGLPGDGESKAGKVALADVYGEVTVQKDKALTVSADVIGDDLEAIDPRELSLLSQDGSLAYRYYSQPVSLKVAAAKHEIQAVVETVVSKGLIEVVVDQDDKASYRCRFKLKTSERQRLRIDLPKGAEILGVLVDNKSVSPEKAGKPSDDPFDSYFVSVARSGKSDEVFSITLQFLWPINPKPFDGWNGKLRVSLPRIGEPKGSGVAVQQLRTVVWVPEKFSLVGTPDLFVREQHLTLDRAFHGQIASTVNQAELDQWINTSSVGVAEFATQGQAYSFHNLGGAEHLVVTWWKISFASIVATISLFVLGAVLIPTTWRNRLGWVLAGVLVAVCTGLNDADTVLHGVAVARWGIALMFALWIVQSLFGVARRSKGTTFDWSQPFPATVSPPPDPGT
ncbi:MAG: hypothetical protein ACKV2Q_17930 [Planctomycetaceae bacterium]